MRKTLIAIAIAEDATRDARAALDAFGPRADLAELRVDGMRECDLNELLRDRPCPVIVTNRAAWEGGRCDTADAERLAVLYRAAELGAEHVDCELRSVGALDTGAIGDSKLIVSSHNFAAMPDLAEVRDACTAAGAAIAKVVGMAEQVDDALAALGALSGASSPVISLAMGPQGALSRILAPKYGAYLTFASREDGQRATGPGQLSLDAMRNVYFAQEMDAETEVYAWVAKAPVDEAKFARANRQIREAGGNAVLVPVRPGDGDPCPRDIGRALTAFGFQAVALADLPEPAVLAGRDLPSPFAPKPQLLDILLDLALARAAWQSDPA